MSKVRSLFRKMESIRVQCYKIRIVSRRKSKWRAQLKFFDRWIRVTRSNATTSSIEEPFNCWLVFYRPRISKIFNGKNRSKSMLNEWIWLCNAFNCWNHRWEMRSMFETADFLTSRLGRFQIDIRCGTSSRLSQWQRSHSWCRNNVLVHSIQTAAGHHGSTASHHSFRWSCFATERRRRSPYGIIPLWRAAVTGSSGI